MKNATSVGGVLALLIVLGSSTFAQQDKKEASFKWINAIPKGKFPGLTHGTFRSAANNVDVGFCIYLPPGYDDPASKERRYPVVYWLHGGRPGGETKVISLTPHFDAAIKKGTLPPMIYVFPNGGVVSHYDYPKLKSLGETAFIKELIPHIDKNYPDHRLQRGAGAGGILAGWAWNGPLYVQVP